MSPRVTKLVVAAPPTRVLPPPLHAVLGAMRDRILHQYPDSGRVAEVRLLTGGRRRAHLPIAFLDPTAMVSM